MSLFKFFQAAFLMALLTFAASQTSAATTPTTTKSGKTNKEPTKVEKKKIKKGVTGAKKAAAPVKAGSEKKVSRKAESKAKQNPKASATKKTASKVSKKIATAGSYKHSGTGTSFFTILFFSVTLLCAGAFCFAIWLDYRPTIYPSGKVYGPLEYLQGPFVTEINGAARQPPAASKNATAKNTAGLSNANVPAPVTVTREPVHKSVKNPAAKAS